VFTSLSWIRGKGARGSVNWASEKAIEGDTYELPHVRVVPAPPVIENVSEIRCAIYSETRSSDKLKHWQPAVTPKDTVAGNFVPKLDFLGYYHATCKSFSAPDYCPQGSTSLVDHNLRFDSVFD
jgi:hypothetical protein